MTRSGVTHGTVRGTKYPYTARVAASRATTAPGGPALRMSRSVSQTEELRPMANQMNHQDIVKRLLDSKAVDFNAIGKAVSEIGPSLAMVDDGVDGFCGTMRHFIILYRYPTPPVVSVETEE
jgi:hypothetical protein